MERIAPEILSKNKPKVDKASLQFETVGGVDRLRVVAEGRDKNGSNVSFKFRWTKNDEPAGESDTLIGFKRGDRISVIITPYDDQGIGLATNISRVIANTSPRIIEHREASFDGNVWRYQVKATDADDDSLTYALKSAPRGMIIEPSTGLIKWDAPSDFLGKTSFTISVTDGHGGEASQDLSIEINKGQK